MHHTFSKEKFGHVLDPLVQVVVVSTGIDGPLEHVQKLNVRRPAADEVQA